MPSNSASESGEDWQQPADMVEDASGSEPRLDDSPSSDQQNMNDSSEGQEDAPDSSEGGCGYSMDYSDEDEEGMGGQAGWPPVFCTNCTARMSRDAGTCLECGHSPADDGRLFASTVQPADANDISQPSTSGQQQHQQQVVLAWDEAMEQHEEGRTQPHPERPDRLRAVVARMLSSGVADHCRRVPCRDATVAELSTVHTADLIKFVSFISEGRGRIEDLPLGVPFLMTSDSYANAHTFKCARMAAGSAAEVASMVARGDAAHGAAIIRPPGHHAESNVAMGFCFFNNAAVAARAAQQAGARRVLILDWDVHHGNGTQHIFEDDPSVMFMSLHRHDHGHFYPGTGAFVEVGKGPGAGYTVNVAWDGPGIGNGDYLTAFHQLLLPVAYEYNPDLIIVSAGFDACEGDPIGDCRVTPEGYAHMTALLKAVAPMVLLLEGGYNLTSTAAATEACLRVLLGQQPPRLPGPRYASPLGARAVQQTMRCQAPYWRCLRMMYGPLLQQAAAMGGAPSARVLVRAASVMAAAQQQQQHQQQQGGVKGVPAVLAAAVAAAPTPGQGAAIRPAGGSDSNSGGQSAPRSSSGVPDTEADTQVTTGGGASERRQQGPHAGGNSARAGKRRASGSGIGRQLGGQSEQMRAALRYRQKLLKSIQRRALRTVWKRSRSADAAQKAAVSSTGAPV